MKEDGDDGSNKERERGEKWRRQTPLPSGRHRHEVQIVPAESYLPNLRKIVPVRNERSLTQLFVASGFIRAGDGIRTRDFQLGKLALYH